MARREFKREFYNGYLYRIQIDTDESTGPKYTQKTVYYIISDNDNYPSAKKDIKEIMNDGSWCKSKWMMNNKTMEGALHPYHEFSYDEEADAYKYVLVKPYDD